MSSHSPDAAIAPKRARFGVASAGAAPAAGGAAGGGAGGIGTDVAEIVDDSDQTPPCLAKTCTSVAPAPTKSVVPSRASDAPKPSPTADFGPVSVAASAQPRSPLR